MTPVNLPTDLLRTFVTVTDLRGYTRAAKVLNRTQPAISLQMQRLENLVGKKLIRTDGRRPQLTEAGEALAAFARQILHLNDKAIAHFHRADLTGILKIGLPTDFAVSFLQETVARFILDYPDVDIEINCDLSRNLMQGLHGDEINLVVALISEKDQQYLFKAWEDEPIWVTAKTGQIHKTSPLPLVGHPEGCEYRNRMTNALKSVGSAWRIAYTSPDILGVQDAVVAGIGVSALTRATLLDNMRVLTKKDEFPALEKIRIGLFFKHPTLSDAGLELSNRLIASLDQSTNQHFTRSAHP